MGGFKERSLEELYRDDPERADALVFGRKAKTNRRGFLKGAGLTTMTAAVGATIPFAENLPAGLVPAALAQGTPGAAPAKPDAPKLLKMDGKAKLVVLGDKPLNAETPEMLDDDVTPIDKFFIRNNGLVPDAPADPKAWKIKIDGEVNNAARDHARRSDEPLPATSPTSCSWNAAATAARSSRPRRAATSGPTAAPAAPNGPACGWPTC